MVKKENDVVSWMDDIEVDKVSKVAELEILPSLKIEVGKVEHVKLLTEPKLTEFKDGNKYFTMEVLKDGVKHQLNCNAKSFRFQLAVLIKKYGIEAVFSELVGITKILTDINTNGRVYKNAEVYSLSIIESE